MELAEGGGLCGEGDAEGLFLDFWLEQLGEWQSQCGGGEGQVGGKTASIPLPGLTDRD